MKKPRMKIAAWKPAIHGTASRLASRSSRVPSARVRLALPVWGGRRSRRSLSKSRTGWSTRPASKDWASFRSSAPPPQSPMPFGALLLQRLGEREAELEGHGDALEPLRQRGKPADGGDHLGDPVVDVRVA
jgi:hypothetical protein